MIVSQAEIDLVLNPKIHRRMMRLPAPTTRCPVMRGRTYKLQPRPTAKGQVTIAVIEPPRRERLAALTLQDAKREGYAGVQGALDAWAKTYWTPGEDEMVWVVSFARDDHSAAKGECAAFLNQDEPVYLSKYGDYTTTASKQTVRGDPELSSPFAKDLEQARKKARERRVTPQRKKLKDAAGEIETLRESIEGMKARTLLRRAARTIEAAERVLLSEQVVDCGESAAEAGSTDDAEVTGPPSCGRAVASLDVRLEPAA